MREIILYLAIFRVLPRLRAQLGMRKSSHAIAFFLPHPLPSSTSLIAIAWCALPTPPRSYLPFGARMGSCERTRNSKLESFRHTTDAKIKGIAYTITAGSSYGARPLQLESLSSLRGPCYYGQFQLQYY
jgi:hypothetical protein